MNGLFGAGTRIMLEPHRPGIFKLYVAGSTNIPENGKEFNIISSGLYDSIEARIIFT